MQEGLQLDLSAAFDGLTVNHAVLMQQRDMRRLITQAIISCRTALAHL